jgi:hypothetical protein
MDLAYAGTNGKKGLTGITAGKASQPVAAMQELRLRSWVLGLAIVAVLLIIPAAKAQLPDQGPTQPLSENPGLLSGNYSFQQSVEFGYRDSVINGNMNNYNTFENLGSGLRLFDYTLDMKAQNHKGLLFDNLSFSNFGYGGDPNSVSRLHMDKNKWYDFRVLYRRDEYFFDYDLLANPLNTATFPSTCGTTVTCRPVAIVNSPHALYEDRHMQDYDLTLLPESRIRFRLGYSHIFSGGPGDTTLEGGTDTELSQTTATTTDAYRVGADYRGIARTVFSFDEMLNYTKMDQTATDANTLYQLANGTPVDLGIVFQGTTPCATPVTNATTTPETVTSNCNGYLSYSKVQNPRSSFPAERFSFESSYFKNLQMNGSVAYTGGRNMIPDFNEVINGWGTRTLARISTTAGPASASRVAVNADWAADYRVTDKFHIIDEFHWDDWRIPGMWDTVETNLYATIATGGLTGLQLPISEVTPANFATVCPAPYTGANCPSHNTSASADYTNELVSQFLGQDLKSNIFQLHYDFASWFSARLGYEYTSRAISDFSATWDTGEIYFPGGAGGTPGYLQGGTTKGNYYLAARGDCAIPTAGSTTLPTGCVLNANGSLQEGSPTNLVPEATNDSARNFYLIHENIAFLGVTLKPVSTLRINADVDLGSNDNSFTRISPREVQVAKVHATYTPYTWASFTAALDIHENRDDVYTVDNIEHGRSYSLGVTLAPAPKFWIDLGYNYMDIYTQTEICFADTGSTTFTSVCPVSGGSAPLGTQSLYSSQDSYTYLDVMWKPCKRVTATFGYLGTLARGNTTFLNPLSPTGTLDFDYLKPYGSLVFDIYKGFSYKTAWNYYGYSDKGITEPVGLAPIPLQNFEGNNITFSFLATF